MRDPRGSKADRNEIYFERGTAPKTQDRNASGSGLAAQMDNRSESARAWHRAADNAIAARKRNDGKPWAAPVKKEKKKPCAIQIPRLERPQTEEESQADQKRIDAPFTLIFRELRANDYHFILNAWLKSYQHEMRGMKREHYFHGQQNLIAELAKRRNLVIGCDAECPDWICGFACGVQMEDGSLLVDYLYVKFPYRGRGIARGLLQALGWIGGQEIIATHRCRHLEGCFLRYNANYNPYFNVIGFAEV